MNNYIINEKTFAIIGIDSRCSKVIENDRELIINLNSNNIIHNSCLYYGSSYQGRLDSSKSILNRDYKLPIVVGKDGYHIFLPLGSTFNSNCIWLNFNKIINYKIDDDKVYVNFDSLKDLIFSVSIKTFESQIAKSCLLEKNMIFRLKNC